MAGGSSASRSSETQPLCIGVAEEDVGKQDTCSNPVPAPLMAAWERGGGLLGIASVGRVGGVRR